MYFITFIRTLTLLLKVIVLFQIKEGSYLQIKICDQLHRHCLTIVRESKELKDDVHAYIYGPIPQSLSAPKAKGAN